MAGSEIRDIERSLDTGADDLSTSAFVRSLRVKAGLSIDEVAERAQVSPQWLERFETGLDEAGIDYDQLLALVRATQPPRPEWWDDGYEHDLHLPPESIVDRNRNPLYWARIEQVRSANREARG
jgi:transcriptional regulator with XRE-family HTH domain